jgi:integrase
MATLKRNKSGAWVLRYWVAGHGSRRAYQKLGKMSHADAKEKARALTAEADGSRTLRDPNITFGKLVEDWLRLHATPNLKPGTLASTESILNVHLIPAFRTKRVRDLLPVDVESFRAGEMSATPTPTPATMNLRLRVLRQVLAWGAEKGIVPNPLPTRSVKRLAEPERTVWFDPGEWARFLEAAEADPKLAVTVPVWRLQLLTASRIGEMVGLTWEGVDFGRMVLTIYQPKVSRPKTFGMTPEMERVLSGLTRGIGEAPVLTDASGGRWTGDRLAHFFQQIVRAAGLEEGGIHGRLTTHSIRHTAATWAGRAEVPPDRVSAILGRRDPKMVLRYAHIQPGDLDGALGAVERAACESGERTVNEISLYL